MSRRLIECHPGLSTRPLQSGLGPRHRWIYAPTTAGFRCRADASRFGLFGRLVITLLVWIIPGSGLWTMALHPGTVFFVFAFAWVPALAAVALYISIAVWRK